MKKMKRSTALALVAVALVALMGMGSGFALLSGRPFQLERPTYLYVDSDDTADSVCVKLRTQLHASSVSGFRLLAAVYGYAERVHTGAYQMDASTRTWQAFKRLLYGQQTPVRFTVPSVRTVGRAVKSISRRLMADSASIASLLGDSAYIHSLGYDAYTLPALFIPNTYEVYWDITPADLVKRLRKEHDLFWNAKRTAQAQQIGLTPVEVATLASIVEEETAKKAEKPVVAGLYMNRLHAGMPLQADPTVKFGLQDFGLRRILHVHLAVDSPYNTYKHVGLPPGPIRIPSIEGLESVLGYAHHDYLYMCAKEDFSGYHNFAATWQEHTRNARRYQQELNRRKIN